MWGTTVLVGQGAGSHEAPVPQRVPADFNQWGPRIGLAWNVRQGTHPTVVRAAWGLYYALTVGIFLPTAGAGNLTHSIGGFGASNGGVLGFPYLKDRQSGLEGEREDLG